MKRLGVPMLALVLCLLFSGCLNMYDTIKEEDMPGGRRDWTDPDAPKRIASKDISAFRYAFNCGFFALYGRQIEYDYCSFSLTRQEQGALCTGWGERDYEAGFDFEFTAPLSSLDALQAIIDEYNLSKVNGIDKTTMGIPEHLGASLRVEYASGERIYAYDNAGQVLGEEATFALLDFFHDLAAEAGRDFVQEDAAASGLDA